MHRQRHPIQPRPSSSDLCARARGLRRRGNARKALLTLRLACCDDNENAALWARYGFYAEQCGKLAEAREALAHAVWLFERRRDGRRATSVRRLLSRLGQAFAA